MDVPDVYTMVFQNLKLLLLIHPDSQGVQKILKPDLFKVPDFKAFQHVMNFLLNLLIPEEWKKLIVWPVFDRKTEYQFRLSIKKALIEVNKVYSTENLPVARGGVLTNAGGKVFAEFVFHLTTFTLRKSLVDKYGLSDLLLIPSSSDNHHLEKEKVVAFRELAMNAVEDFIDISASVENDTKQREIDKKLRDIKEDIKIEEEHLFILVQNLSQSEQVKQQLLDPESSLDKLYAEIDMRIKKATETKTYLEQIGNEASQCRQLIEYSMKCSTSSTCINLSSAKNIMKSESQVILLEEPPRVSDIILETNSLLSKQVNMIHKNGVPDLTKDLYSLKDLTTVFEDLLKEANKIYAELQNHLEELRHSYGVAQNGEEPNVVEYNKIENSPITMELNFYRRMSSGNNREALFCSPKSEKVAEKAVCKPSFDSELLFSPSMKNSLSSSADVAMKYESSHTQPSLEFHVPPTTSRCIVKSESEFKPQASNLSIVTGSLLKTKSKTYGRGKTLKYDKKAFIYMQRDYDGRNRGAVKVLFGEDSNNSAPEDSPKEFFASAGSEGSLWDSAGDLKENALYLYSPISLQSETPSLSAILSSTKVEESEEAQMKKKKPRKSLEALITRYKKVINGSSTLKIPKDT